MFLQILKFLSILHKVEVYSGQVSDTVVRTFKMIVQISKAKLKIKSKMEYFENRAVLI